MLRIAETFEAVVVPDRLREMVSATPLRTYEANCWNGKSHSGERRASVLRTQGTGVFAECLAFTVTHLVLRVAESGLAKYDGLLDPAWDRKTSRLAAEFAHRLTEAFVTGIRSDRPAPERGTRDARDHATERSIESYRIVAQLMYPSISEVRTALENYRSDDPAMVWLRRVDHALYLTTTPPDLSDRPIFDSLAALFEAALHAFYPFFLATAFGPSVYVQFENAHEDDRIY